MIPMVLVEKRLLENAAASIRFWMAQPNRTLTPETSGTLAEIERILKNDTERRTAAKAEDTEKTR